jgi:CDGSH-type Zn-finger protein
MAQDDKHSGKPRVTPQPDGPLAYENPLYPEGGKILDSEGEEIPGGEEVALCRCGGSGNKPFCDGTHAKIGFSGKREFDASKDKRKDYVGEKITIHDNRCVCSHAAYCYTGLPEVFRVEGRPWVAPDAASPEEIAEVVEKCPSGALSYSVDGVEHKDLDREPAIRLWKGGPYCLEGGIEVDCDEPRAEGVSREHCTLCRCGASKNKPFCDGTHFDMDFDV